MKRIMPTVSFNLDNDYERGLHEFAREQDKYFSKYVKRLIDQDKTRKTATSLPMAIPVAGPVEEEPSMKFTKTALRAFT